MGGLIFVEFVSNIRYKLGYVLSSGCISVGQWQTYVGAKSGHGMPRPRYFSL
jgi:hypothetical protein